MDEQEELQLFRMLHCWHEGIDDRHREVKLCVEVLKDGLIRMRARLKEVRDSEKRLTQQLRSG